MHGKSLPEMVKSDKAVGASMLVNWDHKSECQLKKKKKKEVLWVIIMGSERVRKVALPGGAYCLAFLKCHGTIWTKNH